MIQFILIQFAHTFKNICKLFLFMSKDYYFITILLLLFSWNRPNSLACISPSISDTPSLLVCLWPPFYDFRGNFLSVS